MRSRLDPQNLITPNASANRAILFYSLPLHNLTDRLARHIGQTEQSAIMEIRKLGVIQAEQG